MKITVLLFCSLLCFHGTTEAQGFSGVSSPDGVTVWAVGKSGSVFRSTDGGSTWSSYTQGSSTLRAVQTMGDNIWIAGDNGMFQRSTDAGVTWTFEAINNGRALRGLDFFSSLKGCVVGDSGLIVLTSDGGLTWTTPSTSIESTVRKNLNGVAFANALTGYIVGARGTAIKTTDGGLTWSSIIGLSVDKSFLSVAAKNETVIITGVDGQCWKSTDGGETWNALKFQTDSHSDVTDVFMVNSDSVYFVGGGGYIRQTINGGASFRWGQHGLHAPLHSIFFFDRLRGWACGEKNNVVLRTTDGGLTWQMPNGTTVNYVWNQKLSASSSIGNTFAISPLDKNRLYLALGRFIYMSTDIGETWTQTAVISPNSGSTHSFYISPKDTNQYVVAFTGGGDRIMYSSNRGLTWSSPIIRGFSSYGMPLEMDRSHPDTLIFGPEDGYLYISRDFGASWDTLSHPGFNSPCDLQIVRDSAEIMWVGDSGPSRISRSTNGGQNWTLMLDGGSSEIPTIANSNMLNNQGFATMWGSGGVQKTTNYGATWSATASTGSAWGVDIAKDDPNVVMFGVYGGGLSYLSTNAGGSFTSTSLTGSNYAIMAYDRATFFAQQSGGVFKMSITYIVPTSNTQILNVVAPNGGENWVFGTTKQVRWSSSNVSALKIEYSLSPGSTWQTIAASIPAASGSFNWAIPNTPTTEARIRITDVADATPLDTSNLSFSISVAGITSQPNILSFGEVGIGSTKMDTVSITNNGTATLIVSSVSTGSAYFTPGRTAFTLPPGATDTLSVSFSPSDQQTYLDTLQLNTNSPGFTLRIPLSGTGTTTSSVGDPYLPASYVLEQNYPNPFNPGTTIAYELPRESFVVLKIFNTLGQEVATLADGIRPAGRYTVQFPLSGEILPSGIYMYRLQAGDFISQRKMLLIK